MRLRTVVAPIIFGVAVLVLWQLAVVVFDIKQFVLPSPLLIGQRFTASLSYIATGVITTGTNALIGLVVGTVIGVVLAIVSALVRPFNELSQPIVVALSVVPLVALAPVLYAMYGAGAETTRQVVAAIAVFVPVYVNTLRGLRQVRPVHRDLMRAYAASPFQVTRTVTIPGALPFIFTGLRIASSLAVISALIAEYFGGPVDGLGRAITSAASQSDYALAYAIVLGSVILGLVFYCVTLALEKFATRHSPSPH